MTTPQVNRSQLDAFLKSALSGTLPECPNTTGHLTIPHDTRQETPNTWCREFQKFKVFWFTGIPSYSLFVGSNRKLKFTNWSVLPIVTCPGAGACISFCYSLKSWMHPGAFYRQLQNTLLLQSVAGRAHIEKAWMDLPYGVTVRLFVDGDIDSIETLEFVFRLCEQRPDLQPYSYSKSWKIFLQYAQTGKSFPTNYTLNLSSGSIYGDAIKEKMLALPITRGTFEAFQIDGYKVMPDKQDRVAWLAYSKALKAKAGYQKSFVCPGKCYSCLPLKSHACGSSARFKGIPVLINVH